jgi:hypothetical protein
MRPVLAGAMRMESLKDGSADIMDVKLANDALDVKVENERRYQAAVNKK